MDTVCKRLILFVLVLWSLNGSLTARAASYKQAVEAYSDQKYSKSYKKAMTVAREYRGTRRGKALMLAAAAVLEMDREQKAKTLFKKALDEDPDLELPDVVRSRRAQRFFADVRDGREARAPALQVERTTHGFDRLETYLPFGLNQIVQGKYLLGLSFGSAQAFGLFFAYTKNTDAIKTEQEIQLVRQRAIQSGDDINPVFLDFVSKNQAFVKRARQTAQLSLLLAGAAYGASVLEAGFRAPLPKRLSASDDMSLPLFAIPYRTQTLQFALLNPMQETQALQVSLEF